MTNKKIFITASSRAIIIEMLGKKVKLSVDFTAFSTNKQYMKVAIYEPKTTWLIRSCMKFCNNRGPNCEDAKVNATRVMEKTVPATPIIAPAMMDKILLAESTLPIRK
ncbi:hypothetical protein GCM10028791_04720 [Echinicola sediminis]